MTEEQMQNIEHNVKDSFDQSWPADDIKALIAEIRRLRKVCGLLQTGLQEVIDRGPDYTGEEWWSGLIAQEALDEAGIEPNDER